MNKPLSAHLTESEMHMFIRNPDDSTLHRARQHLLHCHECRDKIDRMINVETLILENAAQISLNHSTSAFKTQLHQLTHQFAMEDKLSQRQHNSGILSTFRTWVASMVKIKAPALAIPTTAAATFFMALLLVNGSPNSSPSVVSFQDTDALVFIKPSAPGLGFFHQAAEPHHVEQNFPGFTVEWNETSSYFEVRWPAINKVTQYHVELLELSQNVRQRIDETNTQDTSWKIEKSRVTPGKLYRLTLSGITEDSLQFHHSGGFILR